MFTKLRSDVAENCGEIIAMFKTRPAEKNPADPCLKHTRKCNGFNGNSIGFNGNYNGVYWYVMDSIGGMEKCPKHTTKMNFVMVLLEKKLMVYNGILMKTIRLSVMVSIGLLLFFLAGLLSL